MGRDETVAELGRLARRASCDAMEEVRAQHLARMYRTAILRHTPGALPQSQFLCILAAVMGRFARDMAEGDAGALSDALAGLARRHATETGR